jgi:hypothetical protein
MSKRSAPQPAGTTAAQIAAADTDPLLIKRARVAKWVSLGQKVGYSLYLIGCISFGIGVSNPRGLWVNITIVTLAIGSVILLPAIIFGYAVGAARRHDRLLEHEAAARKAAAAKRLEQEAQL